MEIWSRVNPDLVHNKQGVEASNKGNIRVDGKTVKTQQGPKGKHGIYKIINLNKKTLYVHRLVFQAFSTIDIDVLRHSRIIFKSYDEAMVDDSGYYRCYLEDLILEECKDAVLYKSISSQVEQMHHPVYGPYAMGFWYNVYGHLFNKKTQTHFKQLYPMYELCVLPRKDTPCLIRNKNNPNKWLKVSNDGQDMMMSLSHDKESKKFLLSHIILASVFDHVHIDESVDHIDNDSINNNIDNNNNITMK
jgi:hypothetical protein